VGPFQQGIREWMIRMFVSLFGKSSDRWLYDYNIDW
jgi:hypothetical protein